MAPCSLERERERAEGRGTLIALIDFLSLAWLGLVKVHVHKREKENVTRHSEMSKVIKQIKSGQELI